MPNLQITKELRLKDDMALRDTALALYEAYCVTHRRYVKMRAQALKQRTVSYDQQLDALTLVCDITWRQLGEVLSHLISRYLRHKDWRYVQEKRVGRYPQFLMIPVSFDDALIENQPEHFIRVFLRQDVGAARDEITELKLTWPVDDRPIPVAVSG